MTTADPRTTVFAGPVCPPELPEGMVFIHLVLFTMYESADEAVRDEALQLMQIMCETDGVLKYQLAESQDTRKGIVLSELIVFTNEKAFEAFKDTDAHRKYAAFICQYADWKISDYILPSSLA